MKTSATARERAEGQDGIQAGLQVSGLEQTADRVLLTETQAQEKSRFQRNDTRFKVRRGGRRDPCVAFPGGSDTFKR